MNPPRRITFSALPPPGPPKHFPTHYLITVLLKHCLHLKMHWTNLTWSFPLSNYHSVSIFRATEWFYIGSSRPWELSCSNLIHKVTLATGEPNHWERLLAMTFLLYLWALTALSIRVPNSLLYTTLCVSAQTWGFRVQALPSAGSPLISQMTKIQRW